MTLTDSYRKVAIAGHLPETLVNPKKVERHLSEIVDKENTLYLSGGARGTDQWVIKSLPHGHFDLFLPFPAFLMTANWDPDDEIEFIDLLWRARKIHTLADNKIPGIWKKRDQEMILQANELLAVYDGRKKGGTADAVRFAEKRNIPVTIIDPNKLA